MAYFLLLLALATGLYQLVTSIVTVPSGHGKHTLSVFKAAVGAKAQLRKAVITPLIEQVAKLIRLEPYKRQELLSNLKRAGFTLSPEQYYAEALVYGALVELYAFFMLQMGMPLFALVAMALGIVIAYRQLDKLKSKIKEVNEKLLAELPDFISAITYSLDMSSDLQTNFEKYQKVSGPEMMRDLDVLIADMRSGRPEDALRRFDIRIGIPDLSTFIAGLIETTRGVDQRMYFRVLCEEMKAKKHEMLKRELAKRPGKIRKVTFVLVVCFILQYLVPVALQLSQGIATLK